MKKYHFICIIAALLTMVTDIQTQEERNRSLVNSYLHGWEYGIKAGFNIGGTLPIPLPKKIRKIGSYAPGMATTIEGNAIKWFDEKKKWRLTLDLQLGNKNMTTKAAVKNYGIKIINTNGEELAGLQIDGARTKVENSYLTIPILANYHISERWILSAGPYFFYLLESDFSGHVYEGHLRIPDQTGSKVELTGKSIATYDFSSDLRKFQWGVQFDGEWKAFRCLAVHADVTWGLSNIFQKDFDTITFSMYPIYLNLGFRYVF